jgi:hypothetical protein
MQPLSYRAIQFELAWYDTLLFKDRFDYKRIDLLKTALERF